MSIMGRPAVITNHSLSCGLKLRVALASEGESRDVSDVDVYMHGMIGVVVHGMSRQCIDGHTHIHSMHAHSHMA